MDGRRYLAVAQQLVEGVSSGAPLTGGDGAPECRSAISRAYYAAFLEAAAFLDRIGFAVENSPGAHVAVQHALNNSRDEVLCAVGNELGTLHKQRRRADYDVKDGWAESVVNAAGAIRIATDIIDCLDEVSSAPDRLGLIAGAISVWLKGAQSGGLKQKSGAR